MEDTDDTNAGRITTVGDATYLMGDKLRAVDLLVAKPLNNAHSLGILEEFPTLFALYDKIKTMPSFTTAYSPPQKVDCSTEDRSLVLAPSVTQTEVSS